MTPEDRDRIEREIDKHNEAIRGLIIVGRTCLDSIKECTDSIKELKEVQRRDHEEWIERDKATDEKLNILIDTVDRIIRDRNNKG